MYTPDFYNTHFFLYHADLREKRNQDMPNLKRKKETEVDKLNEEKKQKKKENAKLEKEADRLQREAVETDEPEEMKRLIKQSLICRDHIKREIESIKKMIRKL